MSIAIVGQNLDFVVHENAAVEPYLSSIEGEERRGGAAQPQDDDEPAAPSDDAPAAGEGGETMETE